MKLHLAALLIVGCSVPSVSRIQHATIRGTVAGLEGHGLVLQDVGGDALAVSADGAFAFANTIDTAMPYEVTVKVQPSGPSQTCTVVHGSGVVGDSDISDIAVTCATDTFTIGGVVSGLAGTGLVLQDNAGDDLTISGDGAFVFPGPIASGDSYAVAVKTQPTSPVQTCTVVGGLGTIDTADVDTVTITCQTNAFLVGGMVSGLAGSGLVLQNNGTDDLAVGADGTFTFATPLKSGQRYAVSVHAQPGSPSQVCSVTGGTGTVVGAPITTVTINCVTSTFTISGTISGLAGNGLVLQNNGGDDLPISANGSFMFASLVASGASYAVTVKTQPSAPSQTCEVDAGSGTVGSGNVTGVTITCSTSSYTIGGTVSGLVGSGLILRDNGSDDLTIAGNGTFTFATRVPSRGTFAVTVATQPSQPTQLCTVSGGSGTVGGANITNVAISCATRSFTIGGTISGLTGTGLVLQDNSGDNLTITSAATSFTFATPLPSGTMYSVTVLTQPTSPSQMCTVSAGSGTVGSGNVTGIVISCAASRYTIGGQVYGALGSGLVLQNNGGDNLNVNASGAFAFATTLTSGSTYAVTVQTQPSSPTQVCTVTSGTGTVASSNVTSVVINCTTSSFSIGGVVSGLTGSGLLLRNNGGDDLAITANAPFVFPTKLLSGTTYAVTVATQPNGPAQTCSVTAGSGTVGGSNVNNVAISCATNTYSIGGTVSGLAGTGLRLYDNGGNPLAISANGSFQFTGKIASGQSYSVTVATQPSNPTQTCVVSSGSGTVTSSEVTAIDVSCTTNTYTVGGTVSGLAGTGLTLQNTVQGAPVENLSISANGSFTFSSPVASGSVFQVTALVQPTGPSQTCTVTGGSGTIGAANVTSIGVACTTSTYTVGGTITGLLGAGLTVKNNGTDPVSPLAGATSYAFATRIVSGQPYSVTIAVQPGNPSQACTLSAPSSGTVTNSNVSVNITCPTQAYPIPVTISAGSNVLRPGLQLVNNFSDTLDVTSLGTTAFSKQVLVNNPYIVTIAHQPPGQTCTVSNAMGMITSGPPNPPITVDCTTANLAFATSTTYAINGFGGVAGADTICQQRASAAGLTGTFVAWISSSTVNAASRIPAAARGWYRTDGAPVADTLASLTANKLLYPIDHDESARFKGAQWVATGTNANGTVATNTTCSDYTTTSSSQTIMFGYANGAKVTWTAAGIASCNESAFTFSLYCFGTSYATPVALAATPNARTAFVTRGLFVANGGLAGADALCNQEASAAHLPGTYKAHLNTSIATALSRFDTTRGPWARVDNVLLTSTAAALAQDFGSWTALPDQFADGTAVGANVQVWGRSGTFLDVGFTCADWTSAADADTGDSMTATYHGYGNPPCNDPAMQGHLFCLQQ